ncbi:MAG: NYN domain-containing protein [Proteobacteria bacterium]|nr:NYN domain-containing protein [Pseudomonadota bacterium]
MVEYGRCQLYVDTEYIRKQLRDLKNDPWFGPVELHRPLNNHREDGRTFSVRRTIFYDALDPSSAEFKQREDHLDRLTRLPNTTVRLGHVTRDDKGNRRQKGVDMQIGIDMIEVARSGFVEYIALAAGDGDFAPAVQHIQDMGLKVFVVAFPSSLSPELISAADRIFELPEDPRPWP